MGTHCWRKEKALGEAGTPRMKAWNSARIDMGPGTGVTPDGWSLKCGRDSGVSAEATSQQDPGKGSMCPQIPIFKGEDCLNHVPIRIMNLHFTPGSYECPEVPTASEGRHLSWVHGRAAGFQLFWNW